MNGLIGVQVGDECHHSAVFYHSKINSKRTVTDAQAIIHKLSVFSGYN